MTSIVDIRTDHACASLDIADVGANPSHQLRRWSGGALKTKIAEVNTMTLATIDPHSQPPAHIVLLENLDECSLTFFASYASYKGEELVTDPYAVLLLHWIRLERQVRTQGIVERMSDAESGAYYHSRPLGSRLGA